MVRLVTLVDKDPEAGEDAYETMLAEVMEAETEGLLEEGATDVVGERSGWAPSVEQGVRSAELVVEAVFEDVNLKLDVLAAIERWAPKNAVIATNTSAIPVESLACTLARPERLFGIHWFNPAPYLPSVEVILSKASDVSLLERVLVLLESSGKSPVVVADTPGFVANRLQMALFKEAALMVEEGTATAERIDAVVRSSFGFRLPFLGRSRLRIWQGSTSTQIATRLWLQHSGHGSRSRDRWRRRWSMASWGSRRAQGISGCLRRR